MTEQRNLARFATIANAAFNSMSANSTAITSMSIGGAAINATSFAGTANNANNLVGGNITADYNVTQTTGIRFGHTNQSDGNDGFIAAGRFASGLNIVGTQTGAGLGRQVRIYGTVIDGSGVEYVRNTGSWAINANSATFANSSATNTFTIGTAAYFIANGNLGIGTSSPTSPLTITDRNAAGAGTFAVDLRSSNSSFESNMSITTYGTQPSGFFVRKAGGTAAFPTATAADRLGFLIGSTTSDGTTFFNTAAINFHADATANSTSQPTSIRFDTTAVGATGRAERMRISPNGDVGIGTSSPATKLDLFSAGATEFVSTRIRNGSVTFDVAVGNGYGRAWNATSHPLIFGTSDTERMRIDSAGNVGIGTSAPANRLHVVGADGVALSRIAGASFATRFISAPGVGAVVEATSSNEATYEPLFLGGSQIRFTSFAAERMRMDGSGNLGIGTSSPLARLDVVSSDRKRIRATGASEEGMILFQNGTTGTSTTSGFLVGIGGDSIAYLLNYHNSPTIFHTNGTERMRIDASGNVGIGTSSPGYKLDVLGTLRSAGLANFDNAISLNTASLNYLYYTSALAFAQTGTGERMRIDASGNVGIGTTAGAARLRVSAAAAVNAPVLGNVSNYPAFISNNDTGYGLGIGTAAGDGHVWLQSQRSDTATAFNLTLNEAGGNVGIGTASPSVRLDVAGVSSTPNATWAGGTDLLELTAASGSAFSEQAIAFQEIGTNVGAKIGVKNRANGAYDIIFANRDNSSATSTMTERMRIDASGNVGIGTSAPGARLDVNGAIMSRNGGGGEGGELLLYNPDAITIGAVLDVSGADATRWFTTRNNTIHQIGQLGGTGGSISFFTAANERGRFDSTGNFAFNSGYGSVATAFGCRAWVNFNGVGTVAIRSSGNVSSVTDNGVGDYTVNFTNAMPDVNYAQQVSTWDNGTSALFGLASNAGSTNVANTSSFRFGIRAASNVAGDMTNISVAIFR